MGWIMENRFNLCGHFRPGWPFAIEEVPEDIDGKKRAKEWNSAIFGDKYGTRQARYTFTEEMPQKASPPALNESLSRAVSRCAALGTSISDSRV